MAKTLKSVTEIEEAMDKLLAKEPQPNPYDPAWTPSPLRMRRMMEVQANKILEMQGVITALVEVLADKLDKTPDQPTTAPSATLH